MENEMQYQLHRHKPQLGRLGTGVSGVTAKPPRPAMSMDKARVPTKPDLAMDLTKQLVGAKKNTFDDIPDEKSHMSSKRPPLKPKAMKQNSNTQHRREEQEEKPVTGKLTNTAPDGTFEERKIDRLHNPKKEVTQKPNFGKFNSSDQQHPAQQF
jgi:hypothetical protein